MASRNQAPEPMGAHKSRQHHGQGQRRRAPQPRPQAASSRYPCDLSSRIHTDPPRQQHQGQRQPVLVPRLTLRLPRADTLESSISSTLASNCTRVDDDTEIPESGSEQR